MKRRRGHGWLKEYKVLVPTRSEHKEGHDG